MAVDEYRQEGDADGHIPWSMIPMALASRRYSGNLESNSVCRGVQHRCAGQDRGALRVPLLDATRRVEFFSQR
jgi:hypothetical protein